MRGGRDGAPWRVPFDSLSLPRSSKMAGRGAQRAARTGRWCAWCARLTRTRSRARRRGIKREGGVASAPCTSTALSDVRSVLTWLRAAATEMGHRGLHTLLPSAVGAPLDPLPPSPDPLCSGAAGRRCIMCAFARALKKCSFQSWRRSRPDAARAACGVPPLSLPCASPDAEAPRRRSAHRR